MSDIKHALILDLVEWVAQQPRPYADVMAAWRTSCPRLTIWEDSADHGFVVRNDGIVYATPQGIALLQREGRLARHGAAA